jgi:LacI family transcriptional regulator
MTVGILVTHLGNPFFAELVGGLQETLGAAGYTCILATSGDDVQQQDRALAELRSHRVSAVALVPATGTDARFLNNLRALGLPHVMMSRHGNDTSVPYVGPDDVLGGRLATEHLISHGAQTFAYVGGSPAIRARQDRQKGMKDALTVAGIDPSQVIDMPSETSGQGGLRAGSELLASHPLPDAIVCHSDSVAFGVYRALRIRNLVSAVRVTGYDDIATAELWEPPLTTVATHPAFLGERSAKHLLDQIQRGVDDGFVRIPPRLQIRESCGCVPKPSAS